LRDIVDSSFVIDSYGYVFFLLFGLFLIFKNYNKIFLIFLIIFSGFRGGIGTDFINHKKYYLFNINDSNFEVGYVGIMNLFAYFNFSIFHLQFFFSAATLILVSIAINNYQVKTRYFWMFYLVFPYTFLYSFIFIRQYLAIAIIFWSFNFLLNNKLLKFVITVLIGSLFHYSCLFAGILIYFLYYLSKSITRNQLICLIALSIPFAFINWFQLFSDFFEGTKYEGYFSQKNIITVNYIKLILFNIEALFILYFYDKVNKINENGKYFIVLAVFAIILSNIFASVNHLNRFSLYFKFFELIVLADITFINRKKIFLVLIILVYISSLFFNALWFDYKRVGFHTKLVPYQNILFNN
jgi:hypothetical protein